MTEHITEKHLSIVESFASKAIPRHELFGTYGGFEHYIRVLLPADIDAMVCTLVCLHAAEDLKTYDIKYPNDWWEAVKERWAPQWFLKRCPVSYVEQHIDLKAIWAGFKPDPASLKYGPFLPYCLVREASDSD